MIKFVQAKKRKLLPEPCKNRTKKENNLKGAMVTKGRNRATALGPRGRGAGTNTQGLQPSVGFSRGQIQKLTKAEEQRAQDSYPSRKIGAEDGPEVKQTTH